MATITLVYRIDLPDDISPAVLAGLISEPPAGRISLGTEGELDLLNMTKIADFVTILLTEVTRTIVLFVDPEGEVLFPNDADKIAATRNLYRQTIAQKAPAKVNADDPVVLP